MKRSQKWAFDSPEDVLGRLLLEGRLRLDDSADFSSPGRGRIAVVRRGRAAARGGILLAPLRQRNAAHRFRRGQNIPSAVLFLLSQIPVITFRDILLVAIVVRERNIAVFVAVSLADMSFP